MESLHQRLSPQVMVNDIGDLSTEDMSQFDLYEDKSQNVETFPSLDEEPEVTPMWGGQYLNAKILLWGGDNMARCQVVHQKCDANGNPIGRFNQNPILNMSL